MTLLLAAACCLLATADALQLSTARSRSSVVRMSGEPTQKDVGVGAKAAWFATEAFGKLAAKAKGELAPPPLPDDETVGVLSRTEVEARLRADWDRQYFISGDIDLGCYEADCEFADPFVSFKGLARFKENLDNLAGGFITDSDVRLLEFSPDGENRFTSRAVVKLQLGLPWRPVLAWVWGVAYEISPDTGRVCRHLESWEVSAAEGVAQLFRPGNGLRGRS